jgi:HEAT repeats/PQQ-like domain
MRRIHRVPAIAVTLLLLTSAISPGDGPENTSSDEKVLREAKVKTDGPALLDFIRTRIIADVDAGKIRGWIKDLGNDNFDVREKATQELIRLGNLAAPLLLNALKDTDIEVVRRAEECLQRIKSGAGAAADTAALRLIANRKPAGAAEVLLGYLPFTTNHLIAEEVIGTLTAVAIRDGQPDKGILAGLADKHPQRRSGAAIALCRAGSLEQAKLVRPLLHDPELTVRLAAGIALAEAGDRDAIPVLIDLLAVLPLSEAWQAEDVLCRLADGKVPPTTLGTGDPGQTGRTNCRDAWAEWWGKNGEKCQLSKLRPARPLGRTMVILLDTGVIQEMDAKGTVVWQLKDIEFPLDAQYLPGDRVLMAEHGANRVTERDFKGEVKWKKEGVNGPLVAQRLPNGNTFISTDQQIVEVDPRGEEVFTYRRPLETIRKASRLPNGDLIFVTSGQRLIRLNSELKELCSFEADVRTNGGRIDVLPNGHTLVPLKDANKVVEYDAEGKQVWECTAEEPIAAVRLPNGHTLVTTLNQRRAVEFDGAAQEVWEYRSTESRVTRAWRR